MSGRVSKARGATANIEAATTTLNERILKVSGMCVVVAGQLDHGAGAGVPQPVHRHGAWPGEYCGQFGAETVAS